MVSKSPRKDGDVGGNPLRSDPELTGLLKRLDKVKKYKTFNRWKSKFLGRLTSLVYEKGIDPAEKTCNEFSANLKTTVKCASKVTTHIEKGELSTEKKTVKASLALSELGNNLTTTVQKLESLIPSTGRDEKKLGFTKYHLGAVLIRQGFHQYITMKQIEDAVSEIAARVGDVADRQQLELFEFYKVQLQRFCDIMADLNLYEIMMKCVEFAEAPGEEESSDEEQIGITLTVETPEGTKTIKLEVEPSDTVGDIKTIIAEDIGIDPDKQVIKLNGKELDNDKSTLAKVGVKDGSKMTVEPLKVPITVKTHDGKTIKLLVDPDNYLSDVKRMIEPESGVPAAKQKLFMNDNMKELTDENKKLEDCGIKPGTVLYMEPTSMTINVEMPDGKKHKVDVSPSDTAEEVKAKIAKQTGMPALQQKLISKGKDLPKGEKLKDIGIKDGDDITVETLKVPVTVKTKDGKEIQILVDPADTLSDIKKQLEDETGLPADQQVLTMNGKELAGDNKTASDHGIKAGSVLTLTPKSMKISIELPDGTKYSFEIDSMDEATDVKGKISKTGLAAFLVSSSGKLELNTDKVFGKK